MSKPYHDWINALHALASTPEAAQAFQDRRYLFSSAIARLLTESLPPSGQDQVIYAVWLVGHPSPVYIGSTTEARRRLWDLPIGESHHLSNTYPPEVWGQVRVLYWSAVLKAAHLDVSALALEAARLLALPDDEGLAMLGLGFELMFQAECQPRFNARKKQRDGTWRTVSFTTATSRPARLRSLLVEPYGLLSAAWQQLLAAKTDAGAAHLSVGTVVLPQFVLGRHRQSAI